MKHSGLMLWLVLQAMSLTYAYKIAMPSEEKIAADKEERNVTFGYCESPSVSQGVIRHWKSNYSFGDTVELVCHEGYRMPHIKLAVVQVICQPSGIWTDLLGDQTTVSCEPIGGCALPVIVNGYVSPKSGGYMPGDRVPVQCNPGLSLSKRDSRTVACQSDGTWKADSGVMPFCEVVNCPSPPEILNGGYKTIPANQVDSDGKVKVVYTCKEGFKMAPGDSSSVVCEDGTWNGNLPLCRPKLATDRCGPAPEVVHAKPYVDGGPLADANATFSSGAELLYVCQSGYKQHGSATVVCDMGEWSGQGPTCVHVNSDCGLPPPLLSNGEYSLLPHGNGLPGNTRVPENSQVYYFCQNGYKMKDSNLSMLLCSDGAWSGQLSECVKRTHCDSPMDIPNGNWMVLSQFSDHHIGARVRYKCDENYKAIGQTEIECLASGYWSDYPPRCLVKEEFCNEPVSPSDGFFMCKPSFCDFFRVGTEVHYMCNKNFEPRMSDDLVQTCLPGGQWSGERPVCLPVYMMSSAAGSSYLNTSMVTVVVATSCGVLGLLVLIMVILALKRRMKPRGQLYPPVTSPVPQMPYPTPHHSSTDEHDRLALIAFADDNRVMQVSLPSYEEATRNPLLPGISHFSGDGSRTSSIRSSHSRGDYRPLPSVPPSLRMPREVAAPGEVSRDHHRNSIITTASNTTRDNLSVAFGSLDTVNVSDGTSTSVTVDTYDSMASNPSIAMSQRVAAGSLESSSTNGSLASEAAPLLVPREPFRDIREREMHREAVIGPSNNTDTLRSQSSRSTHSESSPIFEVPEESKDD